MRKLLIVDDEPLVLVGIQSMLKWEDYNIEIVGTARNGSIALELIQKFRPDIVITDIKMPVMTGLELCKKCRQKFGEIPLFIFLTSFDDFEFARRALTLEAVDYLVKLELTADILEESIKRCIEKLNKLQNNVPQKLPQYIQNSKVLQEKVFIQLLNGLFETEEQFNTHCKDVDIEFLSKSYTVAYCKMNLLNEHEKGDEKSKQVFSKAIHMVEQTLNKIVKSYIVTLHMRKFCIIFCMNDSNDEKNSMLAKEILEQTMITIHNYFNVNLVITVGNFVTSPYKLSESYLVAKKMQNDITDTEKLLMYDYTKCQGHKHEVINLVKLYIQENINEKLSLNEVAMEFNFSPGYLSQLFSENAGEGFVEYITNLRIDLSKDLLLNTDKKIYEISNELGFENAFYFSKVFKKVVGVSPRDFVRNNTSKNN